MASTQNTALFKISVGSVNVGATPASAGTVTLPSRTLISVLPGESTMAGGSTHSPPPTLSKVPSCDTHTAPLCVAVVPAGTSTFPRSRNPTATLSATACAATPATHANTMNLMVPP